MSYTKRQFISMAFDSIGLATYVFDLSPQQMEVALFKLDAFMSFLNSKSVRLGYPMPSRPQDSNLDEETNVPDFANEAIYLNLGIRLAGSFGKVLTNDMKISAQASLNNLFSLFSYPPEKQYPGEMPSGAGNKPWRVYDNPFLQPPVDTNFVVGKTYVEIN